MKIPKVIFHIKLIPSYLWWECKNVTSLKIFVRSPVPLTRLSVRCCWLAFAFGENRHRIIKHRRISLPLDQGILPCNQISLFGTEKGSGNKLWVRNCMRWSLPFICNGQKLDGRVQTWSYKHFLRGTFRALENRYNWQKAWLSASNWDGRSSIDFQEDRWGLWNITWTGAQGFESRFRYDKIIRALTPAFTGNRPKRHRNGHVARVS